MLSTNSRVAALGEAGARAGRAGSRTVVSISAAIAIPGRPTTRNTLRQPRGATSRPPIRVPSIIPIGTPIWKTARAVAREVGGK